MYSKALDFEEGARISGNHVSQNRKEFTAKSIPDFYSYFSRLYRVFSFIFSQVTKNFVGQDPKVLRSLQQRILFSLFCLAQAFQTELVTSEPAYW